MKKRSFGLQELSLQVLVLLTGLLSAASIHQIVWSATHSDEDMLVITVLAAVILSVFMVTSFVLSLRYYHLYIKENNLKRAQRSILGHIQEQLAQIRDSKTAILIVGAAIILLTLPILRFIVYDDKGLAAVCYVRSVQSNVLVETMMGELNGMLLAQDVTSASARDVRGVPSDCDDPGDQVVGVTVFEEGMKLSATQNWLRAAMRNEGFGLVRTEPFYPYGQQLDGTHKSYPVRYIADTFLSPERELRVEYGFASDVQCDQDLCLESEPPLANTALRYVFATLSLKS